MTRLDLPEPYAVRQARESVRDSLRSHGEECILVHMYHANEVQDTRPRCPVCYDDVYKQGERYDCERCYGTTFDGGVAEVFRAWAIFTDANDSESFDKTGLWHPVNCSIQTEHLPDLWQRDYIVRVSRWSQDHRPEEIEGIYVLKQVVNESLRTGSMHAQTRYDTMSQRADGQLIADNMPIYKYPIIGQRFSRFDNSRTVAYRNNATSAATLTPWDQTVSDLEDADIRVANQITSLQQTDTALSTAIDEARNAFAGDIAALENQAYTVLPGQISGLQLDSINFGDQIYSIQQSNSVITGQISALQGTAATTTSLVNSLDGRIDTLEQTVATGTPKRPQIYHIDDFGADPTGVIACNQPLIDAYNALAGGPGVIEFGVGNYKLFIGLNEASGRLLGPQQAVKGQGSGLTYIDYRGPGALLEFRDRDFDNTSIDHQHGGLHGMTILGWSNGNANTCGVRYGDLWRPRISDVEINGFNQPGGKGLWGDNQYRWSERAFIECVVNQCTENFVFESNTGENSAGSFDYSQYWLSGIVQPNQNMFVLRAGTPGSRASMNGVELTLTGNCQLAPPGGTNTGTLFTVGGTNSDPSSLSGTLRIGVETSGPAGGVAHRDFMQGEGPYWLINSRVSASGTINLIPFSGTNFQRGTANSATFAFGGMLKNSPSLGSTGRVQSFQSLQLVSQPRGGWYLDQTNCWQAVYVTQASGGTFILSYQGVPTPDLPYDITPGQLQAALEALPGIGSGNVVVTKSPARYVNSVAVNEVGYAVAFQGALAATDMPVMVADGANLSGISPSADVVMRAPGSPNLTYVIGIEQGSIFALEPTPGTYRLRFNVGGLTMMPDAYGDSPFGVNSVDIWIRQPDTGGPAVFEPPFFVPPPSAGSTGTFQWKDGLTPVMSTTPGFRDIIRLTSYNFGSWIGEHLTRQAVVSVPATPTSPGVKGQVAYGPGWKYDCVDANTWVRSATSTWP